MNLWGLVRKRESRAATAEKIAEVMSMRRADNRSLTDQDYVNEAAVLGVPPENLRGVASFESGSHGAFDERGRLVLLYEPHIFARRTGQKFNRSHPRVSYRRWVNVRDVPRDDWHPYREDQEGRWGLVAQAMELDLDAALTAASWGRFQITGETAKDIGFNFAEDFVRFLYEGERAHLEAAIRVMRMKGIIDALRVGDWETYMRRWNGSGQVAWAVAEVTRHVSRYADRFL